MKKLTAMISQPMKDLSEEVIREQREKAVKYLTELGYEVIDAIFEDTPSKDSNTDLYHLAKVIDAVTKVDLVYFIGDWYRTRRCLIEWLCCNKYGKHVVLEKSIDTCTILFLIDACAIKFL